MTNQEYLEKLKDPRWQKKRLEILQRDNWTCQSCEDTQSTFNVHHKAYLPFREPWEYPDYLLTVTCEKCHEHETVFRQYLEQDFLIILKSEYLYNELELIVRGFAALISHSPSKLSAKVIEWALSNEALFNELEKQYIKQINIPSKEQ